MLLRFDDVGRGDAVVLLHARPADRTMWAEQLRVLAAVGCRVVAIDLPGYGESPSPSEGASAPWLDVLETLDHLEIQRALLVGNSLGAQVALQATAVDAARVEGLVLMSYRPHDQPPSALLEAAWDAESSALASGDIEAAVRAGVEAWTGPEAPPAVRDHAATMLRGDLRRQATGVELPVAENPLDDVHALDRFDAPVRIGVGEMDMPDFFEGAESLRRRLGAPPVDTIPRSGHLIPLEQPMAAVKLVLEVLREVRERRPAAMLLVAYEGPVTARFDRDYWLAEHLPLVERTWQAHGLRRIEALFPQDAVDGGTRALALCHFEAASGIDRALADPQSAKVMADVERFTDLEPIRNRATPL